MNQSDGVPTSETPDTNVPVSAWNLEDLDELTELLDEAVGKSPDAREHFMQAVEEHDAERGRALRKLVAALPNPELSDAAERALQSEFDAFLGEPTIGEIIGGCRLKAILGRGGAGTVFAADQLQPPRSVALKVLRTGNLRMSSVRRFQTEAVALARLEHPAIVRMYASGLARHDGVDLPYIVMEHIEDSVSFVDWAQSTKSVGTKSVGTKPTPERIASCLASVCDGMELGHRRGLIHRDLKPTNILVSSDERPHIIDFGVARILDDETVGREETVAGALIGTPAYMAPEQFELPSSELDTRVDVHALGIILYEALSGTRPYEIPRHLYFDAANIIRSTEPVSLDRIDATISRDLVAIVAKAMSKEREWRYATMTEFAEDLRAFADGRAVRARSETRVERSLRWVRRNPAWAVAAVVVTTMLIASSIFTTVQWRRASGHLLRTQIMRLALAAEKKNLGESELINKELGSTEIAGIPALLRGFLAVPLDGNIAKSFSGTTAGHLLSGSLSPDRTRWLASGDGGGIQLFELGRLSDSGELASERMTKITVPAVACTWATGFTADGQRMFAGSDTGIYELFADGTVVERLRGSLPQVRGFVSSTDSRAIFLFYSGTQLARFDLETFALTELHTFPIGPGIGMLVGNESRLYVCGSDSVLRAVDLGPDGSPIVDPTFRASDGLGCAVALSPDGSRLIFGTGDGWLLDLDPSTGAVRAKINVRHSLRALTFSPSGRFIFVGDRGGRLHRFTTDGLKESGLEIARSPDPIWVVAAIDDDRVIANAGLKIACFDFSTSWAQTPAAFPDGRPYSISNFDGTQVRAVGSSGVVHELSMSTGQWSVAPNGENARGQGSQFGLSPDGLYLAVRSPLGLRIDDLSRGVSTELDVSNFGPTRAQIAWSDDGSFLACATDRACSVWRRDGTLAYTAEGCSYGVQHIAWESEHRVVLNTYPDAQSVTIVDLSKSEVVMTKVKANWMMMRRSIGRWLSPSMNGGVDVYPPGRVEQVVRADASIQFRLEGHQDIASAAAISPDGAWIATGGFDGYVRLWSLVDGECYMPMHASPMRLLELRWSPDGTSLLGLDVGGGVFYYDSVLRAERIFAGG
jgi:WD40 repeat protein